MWLYLIAFAIISAIVGSAYLHYTSLLARIEELTKEKQALILNLEQSKKYSESLNAALKNWQQNQRQLLKTVEEIQQTSTIAKSEIRRLSDVFARHDLEKLANRKPKLLEKRINSGTHDAFRMLQCASDSNCVTTSPETSDSTPTP